MEVLKNLLDMLYSSENGMMYFYIVSAAIALILVVLIIITLVTGNKEAKELAETKENTEEAKESVVVENESLPNEEVTTPEIVDKSINFDTELPTIEEPKEDNVNEIVKEEKTLLEEEFKLDDQIITPEINTDIFKNGTYFEEKEEVEEFDLPKIKEDNVSNDLFLERLNALKEKK